MTWQWSLHYFSAPRVNTRSGTVSYVSHFENKLVTKERRRNEKFSEADAAQEKKWWIDLFWLGWKQLVDISRSQGCFASGSWPYGFHRKWNDKSSLWWTSRFPQFLQTSGLRLRSNLFKINSRGQTDKKTCYFKRVDALSVLLTFEAKSVLTFTWRQSLQIFC